MVKKNIKDADRIIEATPGFKRRINRSYEEFKVSGGICAEELIQKLKDVQNRKPAKDGL
jgi:hypothetical protein